MKTCQVVQVIRTDLMRRGKGIEGSVIRCIEQYYTLDGELLFEFDPCPDTPTCNCYDGPEGPHYPQDIPEGQCRRGLECGRPALFEFRNLERGTVYRACANHRAKIPILGAKK